MSDARADLAAAVEELHGAHRAAEAATLAIRASIDSRVVAPLLALPGASATTAIPLLLALLADVPRMAHDTATRNAWRPIARRHGLSLDEDRSAAQVLLLLPHIPTEEEQKRLTALGLQVRVKRKSRPSLSVWSGMAPPSDLDPFLRQHGGIVEIADQPGGPTSRGGARVPRAAKEGIRAVKPPRAARSGTAAGTTEAPRQPQAPADTSINTDHPSAKTPRVPSETGSAGSGGKPAGAAAEEHA